MEAIRSKYVATIGIESHVQLKTRTKLFSPADNDARGKQPNSCVHPIDFGLPGMLPRLNEKAVELAILAGKAMNAKIANNSQFDRKHYFYPDLPNGYQITQMYHPTILSGFVAVMRDDGSSFKVRINHAHLEADAGKLTHHTSYSLADYNRTGTPLIEIVTEPDIHSAQDAKAFCHELHLLMIYAGVTDGDLYHGNMRFDVNVSVALKDSTELGKRAEVKNLNSFRSIEKAINYEIDRQIGLLEDGEKVIQETRGWHDAKQITFSQRSKEDAQDYRYMPDPDIPPLVLDDAYIERLQASIPVLPQEYRNQWTSLGVDNSVINSLLSTQQFAEGATCVQQLAGDAAARRVANWFASAVGAMGESDETGTREYTIRVDDMIVLAEMTDKAELSSGAAKDIFNELLNGATDPRALAKSMNLLQLSDEAAVVAIVNEVLADPASAASIADLKAGKDKAIGYLVGQIMKKSQGKANPALAQKLIKKILAI